MQALGPYRVPHVKVHSTAWYTNTPPNGAFRGFGSPQVTFGHERMMDKIAAALAMDPVKLRLHNILVPGSRTMTGQHVETSVGAGETIMRAAEISGWTQRRSSPDEQGRIRRGLGVAACHYGNCLGAAGWALDGAGARIQVRRDGSVAVAYGLVDMGQGANTVVAQMTAEALGIDVSRITVLPTDTMNVPDSGPSVASRNVVMTGNAIRDAAERLLPVIRQAAAELLNCDPSEIRLSGNMFRASSSEKQLPFEEVSELMFLMNMPMDALGWWHVPKLEYDADTGTGEAYFTYSYATHIAEVVVDTLTGRVRVERVWAAHDVGKAINPADLEGQVEGGVVQGIGWALYEEFKLDRGVAISGNLSTYLLPTSMDAPEVESVFVEAPDPNGPWGAKGIGEPAIIPTAAAVANAISHAMGADIDSIPVRPETILHLHHEPLTEAP
jgi:CO/xanthine dehydrogenase Mo-binding subunit